MLGCPFLLVNHLSASVMTQDFITSLFQVSVQRLWRFLQEPELPMDAVIHIPSCVDGGATELDIVIEVREGNFSWDSLATGLTLTGVNLQVKRGARVAVCGTVGSGKSSLLSCILGEIPKISGTVRFSSWMLWFVLLGCSFLC